MDLFLIDVNYVNFAWGYQNYGTLIISNGLIMKYRITDKNNYNLGNKLKNAHVVKTISSETVQRLYCLLLQSRNAIIIDEGHTASDAGGRSYTGYIFNDDNIEKIELSLTGNFTKYNANPAARELVKEINELIKE